MSTAGGPSNDDGKPNYALDRRTEARTSENARSYGGRSGAAYPADNVVQGQPVGHFGAEGYPNAAQDGEVQGKQQYGPCEIVGTTILGLVVLFLWGFVLYAIATWNKDFTNEYS